MDWLRRLALILALLLAANGVSTPRLTEASRGNVSYIPTLARDSTATATPLVYVRESPTPREPIAPQSLPTLLDAKAWALGQLGGTRAVLALKKLKDDNNLAVRNAAAAALEDLGED